MDSLRRIVARCCGKLPGKSGLIGYVVCCALPCKFFAGLAGRWRSKHGDGHDGEALKDTEAQQLLTPRRVLLLGLDGAGKSSFLWMCEHPTAVRLPGPNAEGDDSGIQGSAPPSSSTAGVLRMTRKGVRTGPMRGSRFLVDLDICEVGGGEQIRRYWAHYITKDIDAVVFFVSCADAARIPEAAAEFAAVRKATLRQAPRAQLGLVATQVPTGDSSAAVRTPAEVHQALLQHGVGEHRGRIAVQSQLVEMHCTEARPAVEDLLSTIARSVLF